MTDLCISGAKVINTGALAIHSCIRTGKMNFSLEDEDCYSYVETEIVKLFKTTEFSDTVQLHTSDDEFLDLYLSADTSDRDAFYSAASWLIENLSQMGATLEGVEGHDA